MATANIPWDDGSGQNMSVEWDGTENGEIVISSPTNPSLSSSRNKTIQVRTTAGSPQITRTINVVQEAAVYTYEYEIQPSSSAVIAASGGTISYTATLKTYLQGSLLKTESVTPTCRIISGAGFSALSNAVTAANRGIEYSTSQRSAQVAVEFVTAETGETLSETVTVTQAANNRVIVYSKPNITDVSAADIPASGGSVSSASVSYSQSRHYYYDSGVTEELSALTTGGTIDYGEAVSGSNLGTTVTERAIVGQLTFTVSMNGQTSVEDSIAIYQAANERTETGRTINLSAPTGDISAGGGTKTVTTSGVINYSFTSGATSTGSFTPTLSISGTGFTLDGTTVTAANRGTTVGERRTCTVTASYSGATSKTVTIGQEANSATYGDVSLTASNPSPVAATGGTATISASASQTVSFTSGSTRAGSVSIAYKEKSAVSGFTLNGNEVTVTANASTSERSYVVTVTATGEGGKSATKDVTVSQATGTITYSDITLTVTYPTIGAGGGTVRPTVSYSQTWGYNGSTTGGGTITSGGTITYSGTSVSTSDGAVTAETKGTTVSDITTVTTATVGVSLNGKSASKQVVVQQAANVKTLGDISYGAWQISVSANRYTTSSSPCPASGGTCTITASASRTRTQNYSYTSGDTSTEALSSETGTPTLSVSGSGASLSGNTVRWASRTTVTGEVRSATVTATIDDESATEVVYQQANEATLTTSVYAMADSVPYKGSSSDLSMNLSFISFNPFKIEWSSGSDYEYNMMSPTLQPVPDYVKSLFTFETGQSSYVGPDWNLIDSIGVALCVEVSENTGDSERPVSGILHFNGANPQDFSFNINQKAGNYLNVEPTSLSFEASGGTKTITIDTNESWTIS